MAAKDLDRATAIRLIRTALKARTGKSWSVTGGTGTAYGWITIDAPPARRTWSHAPRNGFTPDTAPAGSEGWEEVDTGTPGRHTSPAERAELAKLLGLDAVHTGGVLIPAGFDYRAEFVDRAEGRTPTTYGRPYWD